MTNEIRRNPARALAPMLAGAAMMIWGAFAQAADYTLMISSYTPPTHGINARMWPKFIEMVEDATGGRVTAEVKLGLAPPNAQLDLVMDRAADLSFVFHGYHPGRFTTARLLELPGYEGSAEAISVAYWRAYERYFKAADEHRGVKVLAMYTHGPSQLHTVDPVSDLAAIAGLKIRVAGGVVTDVGAGLGLTGVQVPAPKVYETLASRVADGVIMPMEARKGFRLTEVAPHVYEMPGGFARGSLAYIMNEDSFAALPADIRDALEERVFGEPLSRELGRIWDEIDEEGRAVTLAAKGNTVTRASDADIAAFRDISRKVIDATVAELDAAGVDGAAAHAFILNEIAAYQAPEAGAAQQATK